MAIYFDSRYTSDMRDEVKEELLAVATQAANSAKAADRERCAKIARQYGEMGREIAAKIRSGE